MHRGLVVGILPLFTSRNNSHHNAAPSMSVNSSSLSSESTSTSKQQDPEPDKPIHWGEEDKEKHGVALPNAILVRGNLYISSGSKHEMEHTCVV